MSADLRRALSSWTLRWAFAFVLWLALADSRALPELIAAAVAGVVAATFSGAILRPGRPRTSRNSLRVARLGPRRLLRPVARLVLDVGLLIAALWQRAARRQRVSGRFRAVRHHPDPALASTAGRTALEIWGSLTPNRYVIGLDDETGVVLIHELTRADYPLDPLAGK